MTDNTDERTLRRQLILVENLVRRDASAKAIEKALQDPKRTAA
jgi:hypothetical protein